MTDTCPSPGRRQDEPLLCVKARDLNHPRKEIKHSCLCKCFTSSFKKEEQGGFDCAGRFLCAYNCPRQWERCEAKNLPCPSFQRGVTDFTVRSVVRSGVVHIRRVQTKLMSNDQLPKRGFRRSTETRSGQKPPFNKTHHSNAGTPWNPKSACYS